MAYYVDRHGNTFRNPYVASEVHRVATEELWEDVYEYNTFEPIDAVQEVGARQAADATSAGSLLDRRKVLKKRLKLKRGITVDSGAANNVMPKRMIRDKSKIRPSPGSRRGAHFVAANDGIIPN